MLSGATGFVAITAIKRDANAPRYFYEEDDIMKKQKEWLYRAGRTAIQAAVGVIVANIGIWASGITDVASAKSVAISAGGVIISTVLAAVMNMDK